MRGSQSRSWSWVSGLALLLVFHSGIDGEVAHAAAPAVDVFQIAEELGAQGIRGGLEIAHAVAAHARGQRPEARARLDMGLLANGIIEVRHAGSIKSALQRIADRGRARPVVRFLDAWMKEAGVGTGLSGVMTAAGFREMKKAGGAIEPPRGEGTVVLRVSPSNAEVRVDGILSQGSPAIFRGVPAGFRPVEVRSPGHRAIEGMIRVTPLQVATGAVRLEQSGAVLRVESNPSGAGVSVDGVARGTSPIVLDGLDPGMHRIVVSAEGRQDWSQEVRIRRGDNRVEATLLPLPIRRIVPVPKREPVVVKRPPVIKPAPVVAPPPAPKKAAPRRDGADLRLLSADLQQMTWESLRGRAVEIEVKGRRATVVVVALQGGQVIVQPPGKTRRFKIPMQDISWVVQ